MGSCCETCPLAMAFMCEPGWLCQLHLVNEIETMCEKRTTIDRKCAEQGTTIEEMLRKAGYSPRSKEG